MNETKKLELSDDELNQVTGGTDYSRVHETQLGEFLADAYKPAERNIDPNKIDLSRLNKYNQKIEINNNYEVLEYENNYIKK